MAAEQLDPDRIPFIIEHMWKEGFPWVIAGINDDDCSIIRAGGTDFVISSDFLNASPIAVELGIANYYTLGRLIVASNISDLCGSGAKPMAMMACTRMSRETTKYEYLELINGIKYELSKLGIPLIGGDTKLGRDNALLGIAIGIREEGSKLFLKNSALSGDSVWVSGEIGSVSAAVDGLCNFKDQLSNTCIEWAKNILTDPHLPLDISSAVAKKRCGNGGTDLSDGLGSDLIDLCVASKVGCVIQASSLPVNDYTLEVAGLRDVPNWNYSLIIGGDFQFIVTTEPKYDDYMKSLGCTKIGTITTKEEYLITVGDNIYELPRHGHEDGRKISFGEEVGILIKNLKHLR